MESLRRVVTQPALGNDVQHGQKNGFGQTPKTHCQCRKLFANARLINTSSTRIGFMIAKTYLVLVSLLYFALAIWCSVSPQTTSEKVGFELIGGSGQSEFFTIYGGLEFGLALVLLCSIFRNESVSYGLIACVLIHASLVVFRTISFFLFEGLEPMTFKLAIGEWIILIAGLGILFCLRTPLAKQQPA